jgi:intraflagellar transport protein 81
MNSKEKWLNGIDGRLFPEFKSFSELYANKIAQQQNLSKALRKQQKRIKENERANMYQRALFTDLHGLLACKLKSKTSGSGNDEYGLVESKFGGD